MILKVSYAKEVLFVLFKKKSIILVSALVSVMMLLTACGSKEAEKAKPAQIMFNGSSTLAPVISKLATDFTEKNVKWNKVNSSLPDSDISI